MATKHPGPRAVRAIGAGLAGLLRVLSLPFGKEMGSRILGHASHLTAPIVRVKTPRGTMRLCCPSSTSAKYAVNFLRYEPDTRGWIEAHVASGEHMWDIGANIGAYTLYAALKEGVRVTAFEPVAGTYAALVKNISLNPFAKDTAALALALSDGNSIAPFYLRNFEVGGAMHALGAPESFDGSFEAAGMEHVLSMRGDELVRRFGARPPDHLKLDVDGHELRVLQGLSGILGGVKTLWIETEEAGEISGENARIEDFLSGYGFSAGPKGRNRLFTKRASAANVNASPA